MEKYFSINNLSKDYTDTTGYNTHLLEDISFEVAQNSFTSIVAPTGSGKSSLLKIICGLETATSGKIEINSNSQKIIYMPSQPSSFPWFSVKENVALGSADGSAVQSAIEDVGLEGYEKHFPDNGSYAFRFRIALARAIATGVDFIAMDEPFSRNIKPVSLERLYELLSQLKEKRGLAFLLGTSNLSEAILLSDKIYTMQKDPGKITSSHEIEFEGKRELDLMSSEKFIEIRNRIEQELKKTKSQHLSNISV